VFVDGVIRNAKLSQSVPIMLMLYYLLIVYLLIVAEETSAGNTGRVHQLNSSVHHQINVFILSDNVMETATVLTAVMNTTAVSPVCFHSYCSCRSAV